MKNMDYCLCFLFTYQAKKIWINTPKGQAWFYSNAIVETFLDKEMNFGKSLHFSYPLSLKWGIVSVNIKIISTL